MLEIQNLTAGYPGRTVLENLSLSIPEGKVTIVVGPNGCGKSTLLKAIAGILPARGSITLAGEALTGLPGKQRAKRIACLPQNRQTPEITARRLVLHGRFPHLGYPRHYREEDQQIAMAAMERLGIRDLADRNLTELSGGQRQKVYIAMALAQETPVVLMDEPNTFLDIGHQLQVMQLARMLAAEGKTVVLVLHDLTLALETADHLVVLDRGSRICQGSPEAVYASGCLDRVFGVRVLRTQTPRGWKYYCVPGP